MKRSCGVLMHISSLPSKFGIGTLGQEAFDFVDFLSDAGLKLWQVLPTCPVDDFGSPYCSSSTFAGNSLFVDLPFLSESGLIDLSDFKNLNWGTDESVVDFEVVKVNKRKVLEIAFAKWLKIKGKGELERFVKANVWVYDYALFQVLNEKIGKQCWWNWPDGFKFRNEQVLKETVDVHENLFFYFIFEQFLFFKQWHDLKTYASKKGVSLIGDLPIYVAANSVDVWANPENFCLDDDLKPSQVAGCPPDDFSTDGQFWGNPIYNWEKMQKNDYDWWMRRFQNCCSMFDWVRVDHFRGFESFYSINADRKTAREGRWVKGPGLEFFQKIECRLGRLPLIAEDLGFLTEATRVLLQKTGYCGMKVLQFAFDSREKSSYLPHTYLQNSVCYTGTHDNNTVVGWFNEIDESSRDYCRRYLNFQNEPVNWVFIRTAFASVCNFAIIPMQDFLGLDGTCRMNTPGTVKGNWLWRVNEAMAFHIKNNNTSVNNLAIKIKNLVELYER